MKCLLHIAILFFCPVLAFPQFYLKGQVKDESGNALQNANIFLQSNGYVYHSGTEGFFGIPTSKKMDTVTINLDGYIKQKLAVDATTFVEIKLKKIPLTSSHINKLSSLTQNLRRETQQQWFTGNETYASIVENQFIDASSYPTTGLTLNVDKASYSNVRRFLNMHSTVPPDAVRIEEMLNYFNFNYTEPKDNKTFEINSVLTECPWNKKNQLLFAQIKSKRIAFDNLPPTHLVFLIDVSGSMDTPNRLPLLKSGFKALVNNLRTKDSVSIVVYGGTIGVVLPTTSGKDKERILQVIDSLQASGSTPGESGIKLAYSVAKTHFIHGGNNRIILATDGDFNVGLKTEDELADLISTHQHEGIYLTCLGIGMGNYKDSKIQTLAERGKGNFAYLDSYAEAEKVLLKEFTQTLYTVADDAYLNVSFNPEYVKEYRLLGFDNKVGAIKDTQSLVEGGEIGSAYSTLVAFEIVPTEDAGRVAAAKESMPLVSFALQYKLPGTNQKEEVKQTFETKFTPFNELSKHYQFASAVIMFGSVLRKSKFAKNISWNDILQIANASADTENYSQKEFISLVEGAKKIYGKRRKREKSY